MSATLTYKGNTLTTVNNETKVLNTSGTWLEDNITITDVASGITPAGTISIDDEGTYDVTNYASAEVEIDYSSKVREITFVINRQDTSSSRTFSIYGTFGQTSDFSQGIKSIVSTTIIAAGESTKSYTIYCPKQRPIIVVGSKGNYDVTIDSSYGECIDVPHILGSTNTAFTKAIYLKAAAPDTFTITITLGSQAAYPESVVTSSLSVTTNGTYTALSGTAYNEVTVNVPSSSALVVDTPDSHGGTIREITAQNEVVLQAQKTITPASSQQTILPDTGYDGFASVIVEAASGVSWDDLAQGNQPSGLITLTCTSLSKLAMTFMPKNNWQVYSTTITTLNDSCFRMSTKLTSVRLPNLTTINIGYTFYQCANTALIDIGSANQIVSLMFDQCSALKTLIIRRSSVCELKAINNFNSTPFASSGSGGTLYVPQSLIASYQAATNWSTILGYANNSIVALEGSPYENPTGTW